MQILKQVIRPVSIVVVLCIAIAFGLASCGKSGSSTASSKLRTIEITIDWLPSAEYYGIFYAKEHGLYAAAGYDVKIITGNGAPLVAAQVATGAALFGTTTSGDILQRLAKGGIFSKAIPLIPVNLATLITQPSSNIEGLDNIKGKRIGVNPQSVVYTQFIYLLKKKMIPLNSFTEIPIGYGGQIPFKTGDIDAFCAYTTNHAVDLSIDGTKFKELNFENLGVESYGLVLVSAGQKSLSAAKLTVDDVNKLAQATLDGYVKGSQDLSGAVDALKKASPTLDATKITAAIKRVAQLRTIMPITPDRVDMWLGDEISESIRQQAALLYK
ncbi:MAG: ABC transporter substrate-binding protein [Elusimicrobia bacterium]|nr:ABC transporter substrate-binding protein [Elusimicrobiota bacterium]